MKLAQNAVPTPEAKLYGLVRDKYGNPRIDSDPKDLHPAILELLTAEERQKLGVI